MKLPLPSSIKGIVTFIVLMALLPALGFIIYSGTGRVRSDMAASSAVAMRTARAMIFEQKQLVENTRVLLLTLAQLQEVREKQTQECELLFRSLIEQTPTYGNLCFMDLDGRVLAAAYPAAELDSMAKEAFLDGLSHPGFTVHELPASSDVPFARLHCQAPVVVGRNTVGVLLASVKIEIGSEKIRDLEEKHVETLLIADHEGRIIATHPDMGLATLAAFSEDGWQKILRSVNSSGVFSSADGKHLVYEKMPASSGNTPDLLLVMSIADDALYRHMLSELSISAAVLAGVLALALLVTFRLCNTSLLAPVHLLLDAATKLKEGRLDTRIGDARMPQELRVLAESMDTMAHSIETRDRELIKARDAANAGTQAKTDFLANMSHEIRTPMNAILGMTYLTRQGELSEQQRMYMDNIHSEADKLLIIINDILDFSKIEAGKFTIERLAFKLPPLVDVIVANAREEAGKKGLRLEYTPPDKLPDFAFGDPHHCKQLMSNIFANVIRMTATGRLHLFIAVQEGRGDLPPDVAPADNAFVVTFTIARSGGGQEETPLGGLLSGAADESALGGGAVLNLAITEKLVRLLGGEITAAPQEPLPGGIRISLPFTPAREEDIEDTPGIMEPHPAPEAKADPDALPLSGIRILLAEDNPINQQIAEELLTSSGAEVHAVANGAQALTALDDAPPGRPFQVVLMDIQMPELDGLTATRRIRLNKQFANLPVIAMTAHSQDEQWQECREAGMNDFVAKPLNVPDLLAVITRWAGQTQTRGT